MRRRILGALFAGLAAGGTALYPGAAPETHRALQGAGCRVVDPLLPKDSAAARTLLWVASEMESLAGTARVYVAAAYPEGDQVTAPEFYLSAAEVAGYAAALSLFDARAMFEASRLHLRAAVTDFYDVTDTTRLRRATEYLDCALDFATANKDSIMARRSDSLAQVIKQLR